VTKISDSVVFFREDGKPIYSYTGLADSATFFVSQPIDTSSVESLSKWYKILVSNAGLERVNRLLLSSLQTDGDALRSFFLHGMHLKSLSAKRLVFMKIYFLENSMMATILM
jgi:hypothetical protein